MTGAVSGCGCRFGWDAGVENLETQEENLGSGEENLGSRRKGMFGFDHHLPPPSSKIHPEPVFLNKPTKGWVGDGAFPRNGWRMDNKDLCPDEETESDDKIWNGRYLVEEWWLYEGDWDDTSSHYLPWFATCQLPSLPHWQLVVLRFILAGRLLLDNSLLVSWFKCYNIDLRPIAVLRCANLASQKKSNIWALPCPSQISLGSGSKKYAISTVFLLTAVGLWFL